MALLGFRKNRDLDLLARTKEFLRLQNSGRFETDLDCYNNLRLTYGKIEIYLEIGPDIGFSKDEIFKHAQEVQKLNFLPLNIFLIWKLKVGREKDLNDIKLVWDNYCLIKNEVENPICSLLK